MFLFLSYIQRFIFCLVVMGSWYYGAWLIAVPLTLWYVILYPAYELCLIGALVDIQFYTGDFTPYYTSGSIVLVFIFRTFLPLVRSRTQL